ncbi:hypothetical protein [Marinobacter gelidimuriae]|jgi:hypothetical protein|uniref:hypothetical protein n=1 Tax=Marinobacter gelidimuriae TaxID=2739064 RepID=UPI00037082B8|nr:hypothetical protein [Marinobacter gelidimuriae]
MAQSHNTATQKMFYLIDNSVGELIQATSDTHEMEMMLANGHALRAYAPAFVVLLEIGHAPWDSLLCDRDWQHLAGQVEPVLEKMSAFRPASIADPITTFTHTPTTLAPEFATSRLQILERFGDLQDLIHKRELIEIVMANKAGRPINEAFFSDYSKMLTRKNVSNDMTPESLAGRASGDHERLMSLMSEYEDHLTFMGEEHPGLGEEIAMLAQSIKERQHDTGVRETDLGVPGVVSARLAENFANAEEARVRDPSPIEESDPENAPG